MRESPRVRHAGNKELACKNKAFTTEISFKALPKDGIQTGPCRLLVAFARKLSIEITETALHS